jgi:hypothetical protein
MILASLQDAARFVAVPVVSLADSLDHRLRILHPSGMKVGLFAELSRVAVERILP